MAFEIEFTQTATDHVRSYRQFDQRIILDAIEEHLLHEPMAETRNRKRLGENEQPIGSCASSAFASFTM
jgi:hypothetical protein